MKLFNKKKSLDEQLKELRKERKIVEAEAEKYKAIQKEKDLIAKAKGKRPINVNLSKLGESVSNSVTKLREFATERTQEPKQKKKKKHNDFFDLGF